MSISDFRNIKCEHCKQEGFEGRKNVDYQYAVGSKLLEYIVEKEIWEWECKYCGKLNKLYFNKKETGGKEND